MTVATDLGRFVWYELLTTDPDAAQSFYTQLLGWTTAPFAESQPDQPYRLWMNGEAPIGGLMQLPGEAAAAGAPPNWLGHVEVPDVRETARRIKELGGSLLMEPFDIPNVGTDCVFKDPQGAVLGVYKPIDPVPQKDGPPDLGEVSWHELATDDHTAAFKFYNDIFGWTKTSEFDMGPAGVYQMFGRASDIPLGGMYTKTPDMPFPPNWTYYFKVADINEKAERVKQLGGEILVGPMEVPGGDWIINAKDPQGAVFALHATK
jgi:predicted enzyme related to lactoylglutathione lyase